VTRDVRDPRLPFLGGSDRWDREPAGQIVTEEFFSPQELPPTGGGLLEVWTGSAWVKQAVTVWLGGAWVVKPAKRWTGSEWLLT